MYETQRRCKQHPKTFKKTLGKVEKVKKQRKTAGGNVTATTGHRNSRRQPQEYLILPSLRQQPSAASGISDSS